MRCWLRQDIHKQLCFSFSLGKGVGKETASIWKLQSVILAYNVHYTLNAAYAQIICIYTNLLVNAIVRLSHPQSGYSQGQETFLAPSADKQTCNSHYAETVIAIQSRISIVFKPIFIFKLLGVKWYLTLRLLRLQNYSLS